VAGMGEKITGEGCSGITCINPYPANVENMVSS